MKIKVAKDEHLSQLVAISQRWAKEMGYKVNDSEIRKDMKRMMDVGVVLIAVLKDEILGIMSGLCYPVFWTGEKVASEHWFFVNPDFQRKGIGKILEKSFRAWAKVKGCDSVIITPNKYGSFDPEKAANFLKKEGYEIHGYRMKMDVKNV